MNVRKWHHSVIHIAINDESQGSIAKNLKCDELLHYTFITHSAGERIFKISEHLAKLQAKWLTVSYTPFALHFCPQRFWSRQINWTTCVLRTETVTNRYYVNRQINVFIVNKISNCCRPVLTYGPNDWRHQWLTDCWSRTAFCCDSFSLSWQLCTVGHGIFLSGRRKQLFVSELNKFILKQCLSGETHKSLLHFLLKHRNFLNIDISQGSVATRIGCGGCLNMTLLQISYWV